MSTTTTARRPTSRAAAEPTPKPKTETAASCGTCLAFKHDAELWRGGECRRLAPAAMPSTGAGIWPRLMPADWCLQWVAREAAQ